MAKWLKRLPRNPKSRDWTSRATENVFFFLSAFFCTFVLMFQVSFKCAHFTKYRYSFPFCHNKLSNNCCNLRTNLLFQKSTNTQNCTRRVPLLFLDLFLSSKSRCGARHSTYQISNVIKLAWLRSPSLRDVVAAAATAIGLRAILLAMLTMKKETHAWIS